MRTVALRRKGQAVGRRAPRLGVLDVLMWRLWRLVLLVLVTPAGVVSGGHEGRAGAVDERRALDLRVHVTWGRECSYGEEGQILTPLASIPPTTAPKSTEFEKARGLLCGSSPAPAAGAFGARRALRLILSCCACVKSN